jgi:hypothetical protein
MLGFYMKVYHPREISNELLKDSMDHQTIQSISFKTMKKLIKKVLAAGFKVTQVYVGNCKIFN